MMLVGELLFALFLMLFITTCIATVLFLVFVGPVMFLKWAFDHSRGCAKPLGTQTQEEMIPQL
jgi:hypothetical protein